MPYITFDPETGRGLMHVDLASWVGREQLMRNLESLKSLGSSPASEADAQAPVSISLEEAMARVMDQVLAREGDTHAQWRLLNEPWKP